jgi:hypothetical protein
LKGSTFIILFFFLFGGNSVHAQKSAETIQWLSFEQLNDSLWVKTEESFRQFLRRLVFVLQRNGQNYFPGFSRNKKVKGKLLRCENERGE